MVHRLVLEAFVGPCPEGKECRHFPDRTRTNNRLENLSWGSHRRNCKDKRIHGTSAAGVKNNKTKITEKVVFLVRKLSETKKYFQREIGEIVGLSQTKSVKSSTGKIGRMSFKKETTIIAIDDYEALKRKIAALQRDKDKAEGALEQTLAKLKEDFSVDSIKAAKALLEELEKKRNKAFSKYQLEKKAFEEKWSDVLSDMDE